MDRHDDEFDTPPPAADRRYFCIQRYGSGDGGFDLYLIVARAKEDMPDDDDDVVDDGS